ncbi:MAG: hypothetical protein H7Z11_06770 [Verrucomicrobia bacterium]|nr:hypothetical protein [Leptolyngbya sp. ES-bin-22]
MLHTILTQQLQVIKKFSSREAAGQALDHLVLSGLPIAQLFLLGHGSSEVPKQPADAYGTVTGTATGLKKGLLLGNLAGSATGLLLGVGLIALPGVGALTLSTAIAFVLLSGGVCTAAGGLAGAFVGLGLTAKQAKAYSQQISSGSVLLVLEGTPQAIDRAKVLLNLPVR